MRQRGVLGAYSHPKRADAVSRAVVPNPPPDRPRLPQALLRTDEAAAASADACGAGRVLTRRGSGGGLQHAHPTERAAPPPAPPPHVLASLSLYLPRALREALIDGSHAWMAGNRRVSVVFFALPSFGSCEFPLAQALVCELHAVVNRHGGSIMQTSACCDATRCDAMRPPETRDFVTLAPSFSSHHTT